MRPIDAQVAAKVAGPSQAFAAHWPEYLMEGALLACFLLAACVSGVLLEHPASPINQAFENAAIRRALGGIAMGSTAIAIICSPWGQRSGAHLNPAITLTYLRLKKVAPWDALFYVAFQFAGSITGVFLASYVIGYPLRHAAVNYSVTVPGTSGEFVALAAEFAISAVLMLTVLSASNSRRWAPYTPVLAGVLVAAFITIESPLSGMSMNPARTFGSAYFANEWMSLWIYFIGPLAGMWAGSQIYRLRAGSRVLCAKLHHENNQPCIFRCNYGSIHEH